MAPITPLGKPLSQQSLPSADLPAQVPSFGSTTTGEKPISAFHWISLARATWTWLIRPLWLLCVKWPVMLILPSQASRKSNDDRMDRFWREHAQQQSDEMTRRMTNSLKQ